MFFTLWKHDACTDSDAVIMPDGCRDIILIENGCSELQIKLTSWDDRARTVHLEKGQRISGFRLCPGLSVDSSDLVGLETDENAISDFIEHLAAVNYESVQLVHELSDYNASFQSIAKRAGVSTRTLQRWLKKLNLPRPEYWRLLSRARLAAIALPCRAPIVEIANEYGYSDQSHMTRDFIRWFGVTPAQLRQDSALLEEICQLGVGNWTVEQISTRYPLGSDT